MTNDSCFYINETLDQEYGMLVAAMRAGTGAFSALCCLVLIIVIVRLKRCTHFNQRLILYLAIAAFFHSLSYPLARVNYGYTPRKLLDDYCYFGEFYNFYSSWVEIFALCCLTLTVFLNSVMDRWPAFWVQYLYLFLMYTLPLTWAWIPFLHHTYAATTGWCDLRFMNEDCSPFNFGLVLRFALWYGPADLAVLICFIATIIAAAVSAYRHRRRGRYESLDLPRECQEGDIEPQRLIGYPIVYLLLTIFSLANAIDIAVNNRHPEKTLKTLWYIHVLTSPLRGAFIAAVYAFTPMRPNRHHDGIGSHAVQNTSTLQHD